MMRNPVMFVVEVGAALSTGLAIAHPSTFAWLIVVWLWATVVFANLAEAVAEGRGKAQAAALRRSRQETNARLIVDGGERLVPSADLKVDDLVVCEAGDLIPSDGDVIEGIASVDESAITGESAPVIREAGGDRSAVTGGTRVLSDRIVVRITAKPGETFLDRMIALVEGAARQKTPNEIALNILLASLTIIFLLAVVTLQPLAIFSGAPQTGIVLVSLLVCLIPTTIGALLSAIGIAGMDRLVQRNVLAMSGRAVEAAGDVNTLLLDKTGTITLGNREAVELLPLEGVTAAELADAAQLVQPRRRDPGGPVDRGPRQAGVRPARPHTRRAHPRNVRAVQCPDPDEWLRPGGERPVSERPQGCDQRRARVGPRERWYSAGRPRSDGRRDRRRRRNAARGGRARLGRRAGPRGRPPQGHRQERDA